MLIKIALFLIPCLLNVRFNFVGSVSIGEIILIAISPLAFGGIMQLVKTPRAKTILWLLGLYLVSLIASDIYRGTDQIDFVRGWSRIAATIFSFLILGGLIKEQHDRIVIFIAGFACSAFITYGTAVDFESLSAQERYKYGIGTFFACWIFMSVGWAGRGQRLGLLVIPMLLGVASFFLNSRSLAGVIFVAASWPFIIQTVSKNKKIVSLRNVIYFTIGLGGCLGLLEAYGYAAGKGLFGEEAANKYTDQSEKTGNFSVLSGRDEVYYTVPKIIESPFIGWGSWYKDRDYLVERTMLLGKTENAAKYMSDQRDGLVPAHSHIFGGWMEAGLGGGIFWLYVLFLTARILILGAFNLLTYSRFLVVFLLVNFSWDIFFSPYAGERRVWTGFMLLLLLYLETWHDQYIHRGGDRPLMQGGLLKRRIELIESKKSA